jgi:tellurite resistance protein TerC
VVQIVFGFVLVWSAYKTAATDDDDEDPRENRVVQLMTKCLPFSDQYDEGGRLFIVEEDGGRDALGKPSEQPVGRTKGSLLLLVVLVLQVVDLLFAVDSVTAKISQYDDIFINFSSSAFAMLCLRSCYYVIRDMVDLFKYLRYGVAAILFFIGVKLMIAHWIEIASGISLMVILLALVGTVVFSYVAVRFESDAAPLGDDEEEEDAKSIPDAEADASPLPREGRSDGDDEGIELVEVRVDVSPEKVGNESNDRADE